MFAHSAGRLLIASVCMAGAAFLCPKADAQSYTTQVLIDLNTPRPDGLGNFNVAWTVPPAFDGTTIAFLNFGTTTQEFWTENADTHVITKLLDTTTRVPGGSGAFSNFYPPNNNLGALAPKIAGGKLYFWGEDQTGGTGFGLYWISLAGGAVHRVVNYANTKPEGGNFDFIGSFFVSGTSVLFNTQSGVFVGNASGTAPVVVADGSTQIQRPDSTSLFGCYGGKAIDGANVAVLASDCLDPSRGYNVLFVGPFANFASLNKLPVIQSTQTLPGDTNPSSHLDVISDNAFLSGNTLYFGGIDNFSTAPGGFYGVYSAPFGAGGAPLAPSGSPITRIFDNTSSGLTGGFGNFGGTSFTQGAVAFEASNTQSGATGLYVASGPVPVLLSTDIQRGVALPLGLGGGRMAFGGAGFFDPQIDLVSTPSCGVVMAKDIGIARSAPTAGANPGEYLQTVRLTDTGTAPLVGPADLVLGNLTPGASLLNRSGVTQCVSPQGAPYISFLAAGAKLSPGDVAVLSLDIFSPAGPSFRYTPVAIRGKGTP